MWINEKNSLAVSQVHPRNLTQRQLQCLYHLVLGMTAKQIAKKLILSPRTVEHYLVALRKKFNCNSRYELVNYALNITEIKNRLVYSPNNSEFGR